MRTVAVSLLALVTLSGCVAFHAHLPEDAVRRHMAREDGVEMGAICSHGGQTYSEGAIACMDAQRVVCYASGRWAAEGPCRGDGGSDGDAGPTNLGRGDARDERAPSGRG